MPSVSVPTALAATGAVAGLAGAGVSAYGAIEQGNATKNAETYQAAVAKNNAVVAEQNASHAEAAGNAQAEAVALKARNTAGRIRATQGASGIDVNSGSAVDVQESDAEKGQLDTETVLSNAELQAYGYRTAGVGYTAQAGLDEATAQQAPIGAAFSATGGLLSSVSSVGSKWAGASPGAGSNVDTSVPNNGSGIYTGDPTVPGFGG